MEELKAYNRLPSDERYEKGPVAVIECVQEIPCNPCEAACRFGAIQVGTPITNLPVLEEGKCTGCGACIAHCSGLAIFVVDKTYSKTQATVSFPHEYLPLPEKGDTVDAVNRAGQVVCKGEVVRIVDIAKNDCTPVVTIAIPREYADDVRGMARLGHEDAVKCPEAVPESGAGVAPEAGTGVAPEAGTGAAPEAGEGTGPEAPSEDRHVSIYDPDDTLVCRCEEVTVGDIKRAIAEGAATVTGIKRRTRAGMGLCQGRTCSKLVSKMLAEALGTRPSEIMPDTARPPVKPVTFETLGGDEDV